MARISGLMDNLKASIVQPHAGWGIPILVTLAPIAILGAMFIAGARPIFPGFQFVIGVYSSILLLVTLSICSIRFKNERYGYDIVLITVALSSLVLNVFTTGAANNVLLRTDVSFSLFRIDLHQDFVSLFTAVLLLTGMPFAFRSIGPRRISVVLRIAISLGMTLLVSLELSSSSSALASILYGMSDLAETSLDAVLMILLIGTVVILWRARKPVFRESIDGVMLLLLLQASSVLVLSVQNTQYSFLWYTGGILFSQSFLFLPWGMMQDYRLSMASRDQLSAAIEDTGNWLLATMNTEQERFNILTAISRNFREGEAFIYSSDDGVKWKLIDRSALATAQLEPLPAEFSAGLYNLDGTGHLSVITESDNMPGGVDARGLLGGCFMATVVKLDSDSYRMTGVREKDRLIWSSTEKRFLWLLTSMFMTYAMQRNSTARRAETVSQVLAMVQTTRILTNPGKDPHRDYEEVASALVEMIGYESSSIWVPDREGILRPAAWKWPDGDEGRRMKDALIRPGTGIIGKAASEKKPVIVDDVTKESGYVNLFGEKTRSEYAFPIILEGRCSAVLDVQSSRTRAFEALDQEVISTVGKLLTQSMTIHQLYDDLDERKAMAETRTNLIAHDLRNILQALSTNIELLKMKCTKFPEISQMSEVNMESLREGVRNAHKFLEEVLTIVKLEAGKIGTLGNYSIMQMVQSSAALIRESFPGKRFNFSINEAGDGGYTIKGTEFVRDVFMNLFSNSAKYTDGVEVNIGISISKVGNDGTSLIHVEVSDNGRGIDPARAKDVFNRFNKGASGTGLGLPLVKQIMESIGGNICIRESVRGGHGEGTTFVLDFPSAGSMPEKHAGIIEM